MPIPAAICGGWRSSAACWPRLAGCRIVRWSRWRWVVLHDLGKVGVPDAVLNKPGKLTDEEYDIIKTHPRVGADLLAGHPLAALAMDAVLLHHETPDGRGYPQA